MTKKIPLGAKVRCRVTKFTGIAVARTEHLNGCANIEVQPQVDENGNIPKSYHIDEPQLEILEQADYLGDTKMPSAERTGGPIYTGRSKFHDE